MEFLDAVFNYGQVFYRFTVKREINSRQKIFAKIEILQVKQTVNDNSLILYL